MQVRALVKEKRVERLFVRKRLVARFARGGAGLNVPFVHVFENFTMQTNGGKRQCGTFKQLDECFPVRYSTGQLGGKDQL
jgi:hypothetical protein